MCRVGRRIRCFGTVEHRSMIEDDNPHAAVTERRGPVARLTVLANGSARVDRPHVSAVALSTPSRPETTPAVQRPRYPAWNFAHRIPAGSWRQADCRPAPGRRGPSASGGPCLRSKRCCRACWSRSPGPDPPCAQPPSDIVERLRSASALPLARGRPSSVCAVQILAMTGLSASLPRPECSSLFMVERRSAAAAEESRSPDRGDGGHP